MSAELIQDINDGELEPEVNSEQVAPRTARCWSPEGIFTELFFSDEETDIARAKAICAKCALRQTCLIGAIEREETSGVWGGELFGAKGKPVQHKRKGRRPKNPIMVEVDPLFT